MTLKQMLMEEKANGSGGKVGITATHTQIEFCLMSSRIGSRHNLNPNYTTNFLWMQVSSNTLMVYTQGQNNFPLEGFSGDNLSNTVWLWVTPAFHREKWARCSQVRLANSKQVDTGGLPLVYTGHTIPQQWGTCLFTQVLIFFHHTFTHVGYMH